jgi:hypothetical protein
MLKKKTFVAYTLFVSLFAVVGFLSVRAVNAVGTTQYLSGQSNSANFGPTNFYDANYGVTVDAQGNLVGYAWNEHVGWLKFGGLSGFPSEPGTTASNAKIIPGAGNGPTTIVGWARFCSPVYGGLAGCINGGNIIDNTSNQGGWSGWISFDGSNYGVIVGTETPLGSGNFPLSGYAWGSDDNGNDIGFGWMDMSGVNLTGTPTPPPSFRLFGGSPSDGIPQTATSGASNDVYMTVNIGSTVKLTWNTNSIQTPNKCTASTTPATGSFVQGWAGAKASNDLTSVTGGHNSESVKTLTVPGTYTYKLDCLPKFGQPLNTQKVIVTVSATPVATLSLTGNPLTVPDLNPKTNLTYSKLGNGTGAGGAGGGSVVFNSCVGAAANSMGLPYTTAQIPNWVGVRTIPNPTITVTNVSVPDEDVWYSISCSTASGQVTPPPVHVHRLPPNDPTPLLNLTFDDGSHSRSFADGTTTADLMWDDAGSGAIYSSCTATGGYTGWAGAQPVPPQGPVTHTIRSNAGDVTTFTLTCTEQGTGLTASDSITAIIMSTPLNPTLDLKGNIGNGLSDGPETFGNVLGGNVNLQWSIGDVASCVANSTQTNTATGQTVQGPWPNHSISAVDGTYTDGPFNITTTTTFKITCNTADPDIPQISDTYTARIPGIPDPTAPAGPKIPKFEER